MNYQEMKSDALGFVSSHLAEWRSKGLDRSHLSLEPVSHDKTGCHVICNGQKKLLLSSNNYLCLANDPRVVQAARDAIGKYGVGTGGSRLTSGTLPVHINLEKQISSFFRCESSLLFSSGYMANAGVIPAICGHGDTIFSDSLNHASIIDGCRLSKANVVVYRHNDMEDLEQCLLKWRSEFTSVGNTIGQHHGLIVSDAVFSMDGDIVNLPIIYKLAKHYNTPLMLDEAHSFGVLGPSGRGISEHFSNNGYPDLKADITIGTLSKTFGSDGGFVCGTHDLVSWVKNSARSHIFSTASGAGNVAGAAMAMQILASEQWRVAKLAQNISFFCSELVKYGIQANSQSAIIPIIIGDEQKTVNIAQELFESGMIVSAIRYPSVARGKARLRITLSCNHTKTDLDWAAWQIANTLYGYHQKIS